MMTATGRRVAAWLAGLALLAPGLAGAGTLELDFDAYSGGLALGRGTISLTEQSRGPARRYEARVKAEASSWITLFTKFHYTAESLGTLEGGAVRPDRFVGERRLRRKHDVMALNFTSDGVDVRAEPPLSPDKAARVSPESRRGSVDPLSVGAAVILSAGPQRACVGNFPVFDGRRRYDVIMTPQGRETLAPSRYRIASGPAEVCSVTLRPVAGFQSDRDPSEFFARGMDRTATIWFTRTGPQGRVVPAQIEVGTDIGALILNIVAVRESP